MIPARRVPRRDPPAVPIHDRAIEDLRFIRRTMERSGSFTAVPGVGGVLMGLVALTAGAWAWGAAPVPWVLVWMGAALVAFLVALVAMARKARTVGEPLLSGPGRKFVLAMLPPLVAGGLLTLPLVEAGQVHRLPALWLLLYGAAVTGGGAFSARIVPIMGASFMAVGVAALFSPPAWADLWMLVGFGGLHIAYGLVIAWRYGG